MNLFQIGLWFTLGGLLGFLGFVLLPIATQSIPDEYLPMDRKVGIAQWFFSLSMSSYRRVLCGITPHNDVKLVRSEWDDERQVENISLDKKDNDFQDPRGVRVRCQNYPFAFVLTDRNKIIHPMDAELGEELRNQEEDGREWIRNDNGQPVAHNAHVRLSKKVKAVDMDMSREVIENEVHEPNDPEKIEENVKKSQQGFQNHSVVSMMIIVITCVAAAGLAWFIWSNTGNTDSVVSLPVSIAGVWL